LRTGGLYASPREALSAVQGDYLYWTGKLTDSSFQLSLAVIAANWAVFGSVRGILANAWARSSLFLVLLSLAAGVLGAKWMSELHRKRVEYAEQDLDRWDREHAAALARRDPWPFTRMIELLGRWTRELKTWLPLAAGIAFIVALLTS
jgi:hypothetical protein